MKSFTLLIVFCVVLVVNAFANTNDNFTDAISIVTENIVHEKTSDTF